MNKRFLEAVATLTGTTIGAGVLGIPYVVAQSGVLIGLLHITIIIVATITSGKFSAANLTGVSLKNAFMPYGVVLFTFLGVSQYLR